MEVISLQSGSSGNCIYVETGDVRLLFDAGISGRAAKQRLADHGKDIRHIDALIISHDHRDHVVGMGVFQRKFGMPIYVTRRTFQATGRRMNLGKLDDVRHFYSGETIQIGNVRVETIQTPHDAVDGVAFVVDDGRCRFGVLTDLGHVFDGLSEAMMTLDAVLLESNFDPDLLRSGPYPVSVQSRIRGQHGHLSNREACELLAQTGDRLQWACLGHLSEHNNQPDVALATHRETLGDQFPLICADRSAATTVLKINSSGQPSPANQTMRQATLFD